MKCPVCYSPAGAVLSTREGASGFTVRRRECSSCGTRYNAYEIPETAFRCARAELLKWATRQTGQYLLTKRRNNVGITDLCEFLKVHPKASAPVCIAHSKRKFRVAEGTALYWFKAAKKRLGIRKPHPLDGKLELLEALKAAGVTVTEMSRQTGCHYKTVKKWLAGQYHTDDVQPHHAPGGGQSTTYPDPLGSLVRHATRHEQPAYETAQ